MRVNGGFERLQIQLAAANAALDRLRIGVIALDPAGRIVLTNARAAAILEERDGLLVRRGRLRSNRRPDAVRLESAIERGCRNAGAHALSIARPSRRRALQVVVLSVTSSAGTPAPHAPGSRQAAVVVAVSDPGHLLAPRPEPLVGLFHLTAAEARLAAALATPHTLLTYANQAGITVGTARWTLKRVLEKTGCRRQSELVHLVATCIASHVVD